MACELVSDADFDMIAILTYVKVKVVCRWEDFALFQYIIPASEFHSLVGFESEWKINFMSKHISPGLATSGAKVAQIQIHQLGATRDQKCARSLRIVRCHVRKEFIRGEKQRKRSPGSIC